MNIFIRFKVVLKTPICTFDAKTGILCNLCEDKLESGQITQSDVEASIVLSKLAQKNTDINKMTLISATEIDNEQVLVMKNSDVRLIRSSPNHSNIINKAFSQNVWIVEADSNDRRFLENLFHPFHLENVNLVWLPDESKLTRVVMKESAVNGIGKSKLEIIKKISMIIRKIDLIVETEI